MNIQVNPSNQTTLVNQAKAPAAPQTPAVESKTESSTLIQDSVKLGARPKTSDAVKEGIKLESHAYAKVGAIGGAVAGGLAVPLLTYALTMGAPLNNPKLLWGSVAVGVLGGAAVGGVGGYVSGAVAGAVDGFVVSTAKSKTQAVVATAVIAGGLSLGGAALKGKITPQTAISAAFAAGIGAYAGGKIYDGAMAREAARAAK